MTDPKFLKVDAQNVVNQIKTLFGTYAMEFDDDANLYSSTLEGETDFFEVMKRLVAAYQECDGMAEAIKERERHLKLRRERFEHQAASIKAVMYNLMSEAQQDKVTLPEATVSTLKPRASVKVYDVDELQQPYFRLERTADKKRIKEDLENGLTVEGASLEYGEAGLSIRTR